MNFEFLVKFREDGFQDAVIAGFAAYEDAECFINAQQIPKDYYIIDAKDEQI